MMAKLQNVLFEPELREQPGLQIRKGKVFSKRARDWSSRWKCMSSEDKLRRTMA